MANSSGHASGFAICGERYKRIDEFCRELFSLDVQFTRYDRLYTGDAHTKRSYFIRNDDKLYVNVEVRSFERVAELLCGPLETATCR
uniref:Uncharacterized protein n=1 Tax=Parascaris equorum TaxID=6256 RepID=A0A914RBB9_PAREQ